MPFSNFRSSLADLEARLRPAVEDAFAAVGDGLARVGEELPGMEDDARAAIDRAATDANDTIGRLTAGLPALEDRLREDVAPEGGLDAALERVGDLDPRELNIGRLEELSALFGADFTAPDATGEVPTGSADITRAEAAMGARLSVLARIIETLGPDNVASIAIADGVYRPADRYADPESGFLAYRLVPEVGRADVFVVDGLQVGSAADAVSAATLGRLQVESGAFAEMIADATAAAVLEGRELYFAGPSLGGAVAQVAAHEAAEGLVASGLPFATGAVWLVTVDPLGGRDAAEAINGGALDPAALGLIEALNLRSDGDLISRIGSHIGATLTLPTVDAAGNPVALNAAEAHVNAVSLLQVLASDTLFAQGVAGAPAEIGGFAALSDATSDGVVAAWRASGEPGEVAPGALQAPGRSALDATGTVWSLDADLNGVPDVVAQLNTPLSPATADLVLVG